jgi:prepilin-type N-terminal cleavage/methylation domain-containing protein/prepilin-type processing-associated H-X9-DG protein
MGFPTPSTNRISKGFTLIELLVVIAIIALLAAILFPVFARARENARKSSCANNLKQLAVGVAQYTQDFDESFPWAWGSGGGGNTCWWQINFPNKKITQVYTSPSDSNRTPGGNSFTTSPPVLGMVDGRFHISYGVNFPVFGNGSYGSTAAFNMADLAKPSGTVLFADTGMVAQLTAPYLTGSVGSKGASWLLVDPTCYNSSTSKPCNDGGAVTTPTATGGPRNSGDTNWAGPNPRHLDTVNVAFTDGHVKAMRTEKFYYADSPWLNPRVGG